MTDGTGETSLWARHPLAMTGFLLACALTAVFGFRVAHGIATWTARAEMPLAGWMTIGFVAKAWDVPAASLTTALGIDPPPGARMDLDAIADETGRPLPEVKQVLRTTIDAAGTAR